MKEKIVFILMDVQEKLFSKIYDNEKLLKRLCCYLSSIELLGLPLYCTKQYPKGLGEFVSKLDIFFSKEVKMFDKMAFSCLQEKEIEKELFEKKIDHFVLLGIETHICIFLTAKDLLKKNKKVTILADAVGSRSLDHHQIALQELAHLGARITSGETFFYEEMETALHPHFKKMIELYREA